MSNVQFTSITTDEGQQFITVFANGKLLPPVDDTHPNFEQIKDACYDSLDGCVIDVDVLIGLFDVAQTIAEKFQSVSERIKVGHGRVLLDGDEINNALTKQILRFMDEGVDDWQPLVAFFEKVLANPNEHSREQLFNWLDKHDFTITRGGDIVGYKGVASDGEGGYRSISSGSETVLVDNEPHVGTIPNPIGAVIEMARTLVHHDPAQGCSRGLHVGTYEYASSFSRGAVLEVHVNPRDVVSVPTDCNWQKVRCCRYEVVDKLDAKYDVAVIGALVDDSTGQEPDLDLTLDAYSGPVWDDSEGDEIRVGDRVTDSDGDEGVITGEDSDGDPIVKYDNPAYGAEGQYADGLTKVALSEGDSVTYNGKEGTITATFDDGSATITDAAGDNTPTGVGSLTDGSITRVHGKGGPTSQAAKGNGRNPAQDDKGQFANGRPGSQRDPNTGRFAG